MSTVRGWSMHDLASVAARIVDESERCPGCGLLPDHAHMVEAAAHRCPTCEHRDRIAKKLPEGQGWRVRFNTLPADERDLFSSWSRFTIEGMRRRRELRRGRRQSK